MLASEPLLQFFWAAFYIAGCGKAYRRYVTARRDSGGSAPPKMPLPDFFIGAQAEIMGWKIATRDQERFKKYFPKVTLVTP